MLNEKADECRKAILRNDIDKAKSICESLCITTFEGCPDELREEFKYYRYLIAILNSESTEILNQCKSVLKDQYCDRAEYLNGLFETSDTVDLKDILSSEETDQVTVLTVLFNKGAFQRILDAYDKFSKDEKSALPPYWKYFVGLALFNAQRFEESADLLQQVHKCKFYDKYIRQDAIIIYAYLAKLQEITRQLSLGYGSKDSLIKLYTDYGKIKANTDFAKAICGQESLVAGVELQTVLNISIEDFWSTYSKYPGAIQNDPQIVNLLGTYYELKGDYQNVYDTYSQLDWKHNDLYLFKLMYSKFVLSEYGEIIRLYEEADDSVRSARVQGLWLCGLEETSPERFETELKRLLASAGDNYDDIFALTLSLKNEDRKLFEKLIYPHIENLVDMIVKAPDNTKVGYAGLFIQFGHGADALRVLKSIEHPGVIDDMLGMEFYKNLYFYKPWDVKDIESSDEANEKTFLADDVSIREKIADWFIDNDIIKANFLTIKINCLYDRGKIIETLEKSKELYEITKDEAVAANIISLLSQRRVSSREDYEKYAEILKNSHNLRCLMASAVGYEELGEYDKAGFQAYKALYKLNGTDDYEVFDSCFGLHNRMMAYHNDDVYEKERVDGNVVVTLKESIVIDSVKGVYSDGNEILNICLDSEEYIADFEGEGRNRSLGIEHFGPKDSLYLWLYGKKIGDQVSYNGKRYGIVGIVDRYFFISRYVFSKIIGSNGKSKIPVKTIQTGDIDFMKNELISFFQSEDNLRARAGRKKLMDMYHHRGCEIGIPIESLNFCDYTEYIEVVRDLLYVPNQALYAGESTNYHGIQNFVLTLPSLTIICLLSLEGLYDVIKDRLIIPESLKFFIQKQINNNSNMQKISPGKLITTEAGDMMMLEKDVNVIDIWRRMYEFCDGIRTVEVSDKERSQFKFIADTDAEKFFNKMNYDMCQLDAFIVAKEKTAVMIMDDLFFRKLAEYSAIHTTNSAFVLYLSDIDEVYEKAARLSETNYIFTPLRYKDLETGKRFWENLLKGEIKSVVYGQQLSLIYEQINRINEAYGNGNSTGIATVVETMN